MHKLILVLIVLALAALVLLFPRFRAQIPDDVVPVDDAVADDEGAALFVANCSVCHGRYGEGDGVMAPELSVVLQDLRYIAARSGGPFPRDQITAIIDGREVREAHGPPDMPVWGAVFAAQDPDRAADRIAALVDFLQGIQLEDVPTSD